MSQLSRQLWILGAALVVWGVWGEPALWAAVASYFAAWVLFNWGGWSRIEMPQLPRPVALTATALVLACPLLILGSRARALMMGEGLVGLGERVSDRVRLERSPVIAPPLVVADQPQTHYVRAPDAERVSVSWGGATMEATPLGHGVFRVAYDPRRDGPPTGPARIDVDGRVVERHVDVVHHTAHPRWLSSDADRGVAAALSEETDELLLVDRGGEVRRVPVGDGPVDAALFDDGRKVVVSHRYTRALSFVDVAKATVTAERPLDGLAVRMALSDGGEQLAVALAGRRRGVVIVTLPDGRETGFVPLAYTPDWLTFVDDEHVVVALREPRALIRLAYADGAWATRGELLHLGRPVVTAHRQGRRWLVATTAYRGDGGMPEGNHFVQDQVLTVDLDELAIVDQLLTARGGPRQDDPGVVESGASPMGIASTGEGALLIAFAGSDEVWRLPMGSGRPTVLFDGRTTDVPLHAPHGVADLGKGRLAVSSPLDGVIAVLDSNGAVVATQRLTADDGDARATLLRRGERAFYEATRTGLSCQSCHLHGGHDSSAHDITPKGKTPMLLKATISTRGVAGTSPYLRNGDFPRIGDLADVTRFPYRRVVADRGAALDAYVSALALPLNPRAIEGRDLDRERRGLDAFVKARCDLCHTPPAFTNLGQHPTRAVFPRFGSRAGEVLDTPSLLGLWASAPYLIDGRAATLDAVLDDEMADNHHGDVAALSATERADLVHFLEAL